MHGGRHPSYLLPDSELANARGPVRRGPEDMADLVRAMLADAVFNDRDAKDPIELSRLAGLSLARVSSALAPIYAHKTLGFQEIRHAMPGMSARILSVKLSRLKELGLVHREVLDTKPPRVQYSFTEKGLRVAKLGEPVFLYLRFAEGLLLEEDAEAAL